MKKGISVQLVLALFAITAITACSGGGGGTASKPFPKGFLWGVATAAEQSEGDNTQNDWYLWEQLGRTPQVGLADNFYNLYALDFTNVQAMHLNAFRMTFEWARIEPHAPAVIGQPLTSGDVDPIQVQHYKDVIASMEAHGLTPVITLLHWTLPQWVDSPASNPSDCVKTSLCGWTNTLTAYAFSSYARFMAAQFSTTVKYWLTENEPMPDTLSGYVLGVFPPGFTNIGSLTARAMPFSASVLQVVANMITANALAYHAIHDVEPDAMVGIAQNSIFVNAVADKPTLTTATKSFDHAYNLLYLDGATKGVLDDRLTGTTFTEVHPEWAHTLDYIGVNYYSNEYAVPTRPGILDPVDAIPCDSMLGGLETAFGCPMTNLPSQPQGMTDILLEYTNRYHMPMMITENGSASPDPLTKAKYIAQDIMAMKSAVNQGADMIGYMYWTLDYDYEWTSGYNQNDGLFYVDDFTSCTTTPCGVVPTTTTDFTRTPVQPAVDVFSAIAAANDVTPTIINQYGH